MKVADRECDPAHKFQPSPARAPRRQKTSSTSPAEVLLPQFTPLPCPLPLVLASSTVSIGFERSGTAGSRQREALPNAGAAVVEMGPETMQRSFHSWKVISKGGEGPEKGVTVSACLEHAPPCKVRFVCVDNIVSSSSRENSVETRGRGAGDAMQNDGTMESASTSSPFQSRATLSLPGA